MKKVSIIVRIRRLLKNQKNKIEIWDTSAIRAWFDRLMDALNVGSKEKVVIPEGVMHELSASRHNSITCREKYNFLSSYTGGRLMIHVTDDKKRAWSVDEQVIAALQEYHNKGYNVTLVTCDRDQAYRARLKGLAVELLAGSKPAEDVKTILEEGENVTLKKDVAEQITIPCITKGDDSFISVKLGFAVYGNTGKRKIGKQNLIQIAKSDVLEHDERKYRISNMSNTCILLARVN